MISTCVTHAVESNSPDQVNQQFYTIVKSGETDSTAYKIYAKKKFSDNKEIREMKRNIVGLWQQSGICLHIV